MYGMQKALVADHSSVVATSSDQNPAIPWTLEGEGGANMVFRYTGDDPQQMSTILRVKKRREDGRRDIFKKLEEKIWSDMGFEERSTGIEMDVEYCRRVMGPQLGSAHIEKMMIVDVPKPLQSQYRLEARGTQMADKTLPETPSDFEHLHVVCLEIKPKCGFVPTTEAIHPGHRFKKRKTRFALRQFLKLEKEQIKSISQYCPLDLFSEDDDRMVKALMALMETPQNNLTLFLNGKRLQATRNGGFVHSDVLKAMEPFVVSSPPSKIISEFMYKVSSILKHEKILPKLLDIQRLDTCDIEGIRSVFGKAISPKAGDTYKVAKSRGGGGKRYRAEHRRLRNLPLDQNIGLLRDWLMAATAKDCSIYITLSKKTMSTSHDLCMGGEEISYLVRVGDLDMKPVEKISYQLKLDEQIIAAANRHAKNCKSAPLLK